MGTARHTTSIVVAAVVVVAVAVGVVLSLTVLSSPSLDLPRTQPAAIFPVTWPGSSKATTWHAGGKWQLRDSAVTGAADLSFDYRLHWRFPKQQFIVVAKCDRGTVDFVRGPGESDAPCTGGFRTIVEGNLPATDRVTVSHTQNHDWGIAIYSRHV
jgi:hypothetical protein